MTDDDATSGIASTTATNSSQCPQVEAAQAARPTSIRASFSAGTRGPGDGFGACRVGFRRHPVAWQCSRARQQRHRLRRPATMNLALYCSVREAAQIAGCSEQYVRMLLASTDAVKRLRGDKVGHAWLVLREDVERFVRIGRGPASKPPAKRRRAKRAKRHRKK